MKKNGFTLLEILIIIIIIGIIATIAITSSLGSSKRINQKLYEEKIDYVLTAATQFGQASTDFFTEECKYLEEPVADSKCFHIKAQTLLDNNYIKADDVKDPRDVSKSISEVKIEVQYYFDRVYAVVYDDEITSSGFVTINNGAAETNTRSVSLTISSSLSDTTNAEMCVSNTNTCTAWRKYETLIAWELSNEAGEKTVSVWFRDRLKTVHGPAKDSILFVPSASTGTFVINDGAPYTGSRSVTLKITMNTAETYVTSMCISNTNTCTAWRPFATLVSNWMLTENDGLKTVKVWFRDESGNHFSDLTDTIIYETVKPTGTIAIEAGEYTNKRAVNLILSAVDHESGMDSMCISNTTTCDNTKWEPYKTSVIGHLLEDLDGDQTVSVWYRDKVGNVSIRYYATTKLDRLPPAEAKVLINNNAPYTKSREVVLTLSAKDDVSKVASVCVSQSKPCLIFTPFKATYPLTLTGSEGVRTVYAIFRDHAGNDSVQVEDSIILDLTKPVCGNTWTPNPATWKTTPATQEFTLTGSTDTGGSGIASSFKCIAAATNNATCMATVSDNAGNSITCGPSPENRIDITPPNRTVHNPISQDWTNQNITVTITSADSESQVSSYKYCITNNGTQCEPTTTGDSVTLTNQGQYTICSLALNHAGLGSIKTCSASNAYKIDKTDPTCGSTWTPNPANWKASGAQTFTLTGSTDSGGSGLTAASFTCTTGTTHGTTCNATIKDKAGNTKNCGPSPINRIDTTVPSKTTFSPTARDWTNASIVVKFTATDPESGISSYKYCTTTNGKQCEPTTTGNSVTLTNQGQYTVCALAINRVGRSGEKSCSATNAYKID
ncbi:MAG: prepilin-type N-terminal cleavage/methylation domain-containing protein, partial [Mollicutes bacterium]|nr:prepilin-type N-terminal cleavage/methylation domain-containing protein [Mollicutes bacterium]